MLRYVPQLLFHLSIMCFIGIFALILAHVGSDTFPLSPALIGCLIPTGGILLILSGFIAEGMADDNGH